MLSRSRLTVVLLLWLVAAGVYVAAAARQKARLNLSAAAGGQYPYLKYADGIARDGLSGYFGDRNRMPLVPALLAMVWNRDWDTFVARGAWFGIISSLAILVGLGLLHHRVLAPWPATALTLTAAFVVFIPKASFVQAELLYYALFFLSLLMLCRLIRRPQPAWAAGAGVVLGLTFLTKASALPVLAAYVVVAAVVAVARAMPPSRVALARAGSSRRLEPAAQEDTPRGLKPAAGEVPAPRRIALCAAVVPLVFVAVVYPYISNSRARFGRYFYNVNSTFFMWCDNWTEAQAFADKHRISERFPDAPAGEIPGPAHYWRTHTTTEITGRVSYGLGTLAAMAWRSSYGKYLAAAMVLIAIAALRNARRIWHWSVEDWALGVFCALVLGGYTLVYAWYVSVAYGDRFILSLMLPVMFAAFWVVQVKAAKGGSDEATKDGGGTLRVRPTRRWDTTGLADAVAMVLLLAVTVEAAITTSTSLYQPSDNFVRFYFNESRELARRGDFREAAKGLAGVIELDPSFVAAYRELGAIWLKSDRFDEAIAILDQAVTLDPSSADTHNSLGSALARAGRPAAAIESFQRATGLDANLASAWYNLGALCHQQGNVGLANDAVQRLRLLQPELARQLSQHIEED